MLIKKLTYREIKSFLNIYSDYINQITKNISKKKKFTKKFLDNLILRKFKVYCVFKGKLIIGFLIYKTDRKVCYIRDVHIINKFQKNGIATLIIKDLIKKFKRRGINLIKIEILNSNKKVEKFWRNLRFVEISKTYILEI